MTSIIDGSGGLFDFLGITDQNNGGTMVVKALWRLNMAKFSQEFLRQMASPMGSVQGGLLSAVEVVQRHCLSNLESEKKLRQCKQKWQSTPPAVLSTMLL